jgi:hypothetical protein
MLSIIMRFRFVNDMTGHVLGMTSTSVRGGVFVSERFTAASSFKRLLLFLYILDNWLTDGGGF